LQFGSREPYRRPIYAGYSVFPAKFLRKIAGTADAAARRGMLGEMRSPRRSMTLFLALVTTLLGEFFLLVWRVQERPVLAVIAAVLFAVAAVIWVFAILRLRRDRRR
jgi:hypothetical protein